jgi:acetyl/propionyl-CoA carboxylase alpha subunit
MNRVLIANRGEIACRVIRSCNMDAVLAAARAARADAVHPGYGFLAENPRFAERVVADGLIWIGPRPKTIEDMGDKERARLLAKAAGVPVLPGSPRFGPHDVSGLEEEAGRVGYPLLVKAAAGGGGIGMQRVDGPEKLAGVVDSTQKMAERAFGDGTIYLERLVPKARHVEIQVFGFGAAFRRSSRRAPHPACRARRGGEWPRRPRRSPHRSAMQVPARSSLWSTPRPASSSSSR